jgi:hypothetical protein
VSEYTNVQDIAAIPTEYRGTLFRSRLEARWAVFFDFMGIRWAYEPQCFEKDYGNRVIRYLPDFYLPGLQCWAEVKGTQNNLNADWDSKMKHILDYSPSPIYETLGTNKGFVILGSIPVYNHNLCALPSFAFIQHHEGLFVGNCTFFPRYCISNEARLHVQKLIFPYSDGEFIDLDNEWVNLVKDFNGARYVYESVKICFDTARNWDFVKEECQ